jgi:hypothetical protein
MPRHTRHLYIWIWNDTWYVDFSLRLFVYFRLLKFICPLTTCHENTCEKSVLHFDSDKRYAIKFFEQGDTGLRDVYRCYAISQNTQQEMVIGRFGADSRPNTPIVTWDIPLWCRYRTCDDYSRQSQSNHSIKLYGFNATRFASHKRRHHEAYKTTRKGYDERQAVVLLIVQNLRQYPSKHN